jgi:hypothetical protein
MSDEFNDKFNDEFDDAAERDKFEQFYQNYLRDKKTIEFINEYYIWLSKELTEKNFAVIPFKYTGIPNLPLCILRVPTMNRTIFISILN